MYSLIIHCIIPLRQLQEIWERINPRLVLQIEPLHIEDVVEIIAVINISDMEIKINLVGELLDIPYILTINLTVQVETVKVPVFLGIYLELFG